MAADLFSGKESGTIKKRLTKRAATLKNVRAGCLESQEHLSPQNKT
ncbi:MAG: hypothetical protein KF758_09405 [Anaerolineales bacterium]|nr:hypothetical protein [Anaerolineales bacterium]MBX3037115.1 hypothetical protein [Anaerolineales bacterium]